MRSVGNASLTVQRITVVGADRASFEVAFEGPDTLKPGEQRNVTVSFEPADSAARFAMIHVLSDDPDEPQTNVWLTNTRTIADVSPTGESLSGFDVGVTVLAVLVAALLVSVRHRR